MENLHDENEWGISLVDDETPAEAPKMEEQKSDLPAGLQVLQMFVDKHGSISGGGGGTMG